MHPYGTLRLHTRHACTVEGTCLAAAASLLGHMSTELKNWSSIVPPGHDCVSVDGMAIQHWRALVVL